MVSDDDNGRRDRDRPEDNPFIAFRRFADSQVSSLLNTVFTLPATFANFNNAHHAREQCLFGHADPKKCKELHVIEDRIASIRSEGRELYRVGDVQAVLKKGEELMKLDRQADELRKDIVEGARSREVVKDDLRREAELVEKAGTEKGQQWGWSWSWGFPRPFDEEHASQGEGHKNRRMCRWRRRIYDEDARKLAEEESERFNARWEDIKKRMNEEQAHFNDSEPRIWRWSFTWPPPSDRPEEQCNDEMERWFLPDAFRFIHDSYMPQELEKNKELDKAGVQWRDAFEDLVRAERGSPLIPTDELGRSRQLPFNQWASRFSGREPYLASSDQTRRGGSADQYPNRVLWAEGESSDEPSYEYGHDHEDQHDEPPTPKADRGKFSDGMPATELEAYERLLAPTASSTEPEKMSRTSILSTLTTTERTVAPDGTVTTKVVLKKRFADGREESSETVHTQKGQDTDAQPQDPWKAMQEARFPSKPTQGADRKDERKKGWFWSN